MIYLLEKVIKIYNIRNKVCIVTGSGRGIGRAVAIKLAEEGGKVAVNVRKHVSEGEETLQIVNKVSSGTLITADFSR
jgi:3-oxoacyl-[acyl-carrier protein] reductase